MVETPSEIAEKPAHICSTDAFGWAFMVFRSNWGFYTTLACFTGLAILLADFLVNVAVEADALLLVLPAVMVRFFMRGVVFLGYSFLDLKVFDGSEPDISHFFKRTNQLVRYGLAEVAFLLIVFAGSLALILPGAYLAARLQFFPLLLVEDDIGWDQALQLSWHITRGRGWQVVWWSFLCQLAVIAVPILLIGLALLVGRQLGPLIEGSVALIFLIGSILPLIWLIIALNSVTVLSAAHIYRQLQAIAPARPENEEKGITNGSEKDPVTHDTGG